MVKNLRISITAMFLLTFGITETSAQCIQIESILVDACGVQEGLNEMVRFKVGATAVNTSNMTVDWPNNNWTGLIQNSTTASKVAALNADIQAVGGCGLLLEPTGGVLPANATVILVTSHNMDTTLNQFGPITENMYILFQNNPAVVSGHFANHGTGNRSLEIRFGSCVEVVTYSRALLIGPTGLNEAADGATVEFTPSGVATYTNYGCAAPVPPFTVDAGTANSVCAGATVNLSGIAQGQTSVSWTSTGGSFSTTTNLQTVYTVPADAVGSVTVTLIATNACNATVQDSVIIPISSGITPNFVTTMQFCEGTTVPTLATTSPNGIVGTWSPATINNTTSGSYVFTPNAGQCATSVTLNVTINSGNAPTFDFATTYCADATIPALPTISVNGVTGTWSPAVISNTASASYTFTPTAGQCSSVITIPVTITPKVVPTFSVDTVYCSTATVPTPLPTTSNNGIEGTWNPATIMPAVTSYLFTPNAGECADVYTLEITFGFGITPDFETEITVCQGAEMPILETTSPNGVNGTWSPAVVNGAGAYTFTPFDGQCAVPVTISIVTSANDFVLSQGCSSGSVIAQAVANSDVAVDEFIWIDPSGNEVEYGSNFDITEWANAQSSVVTFPVNFTVKLINQSGCETSQNLVVNGVFCNIPKGVSPNGDAQNDSFDLSGMGVQELKIFNRYGLEVFQHKDYTNQWYGQTNNGNELPDATYYYVVTTYTGEVKTGWVYVVRKS